MEVSLRDFDYEIQEQMIFQKTQKESNKKQPFKNVLQKYNCMVKNKKPRKKAILIARTSEGCFHQCFCVGAEKKLFISLLLCLDPSTFLNLSFIQSQLHPFK